MREIATQGGRIDHVQVYTVARAPSDPRCGPLDATRLETIAAAARSAGLTPPSTPDEGAARARSLLG